VRKSGEIEDERSKKRDLIRLTETKNWGHLSGQLTHHSVNGFAVTHVWSPSNV
jgi:hypothetical protein